MASYLAKAAVIGIAFLSIAGQAMPLGDPAYAVEVRIRLENFS